MTRSTQNWNSLPGNFDTVHARIKFKSSNALGIPDLSAWEGAAPEGLTPYGAGRTRHEIALQGLGVHFFLDDYRFEVVWDRPAQTFTGLSKFGVLLTPDFSLYRDWPYAVQIWNVYRSRWCGAFWQSQGMAVIPTVGWSDRNSFEFCFEGLPQEGTLAISTVAIGKDSEAQALFVAGLAELVARVNPKRLLVYGETSAKWSSFLYRELPQEGIEVLAYPSRWQTVRAKVEEEVEAAATEVEVAQAQGYLGLQPLEAEVEAAAGQVAPVLLAQV